jgi:hypothetical protein
MVMVSEDFFQVRYVSWLNRIRRDEGKRKSSDGLRQVLCMCLQVTNVIVAGAPTRSISLILCARCKVSLSNRRMLNYRSLPI